MRSTPSDAGRARGEMIAAALAGSWRTDPAPCTLTPEQFVSVAPTLARTGAGGLAWWKVRGSRVGTSPEAAQLESAYAYQAVRAAVHRQRLASLVELLRSEGFDPLSIKGWSAARLYPKPGMRPSGNFDLVVYPDRIAAVLH